MSSLLQFALVETDYISASAHHASLLRRTTSDIASRARASPCAWLPSVPYCASVRRGSSVSTPTHGRLTRRPHPQTAEASTPHAPTRSHRRRSGRWMRTSSASHAPDRTMRLRRSSSIWMPTCPGARCGLCISKRLVRARGMLHLFHSPQLFCIHAARTRGACVTRAAHQLRLRFQRAHPRLREDRGSSEIEAGCDVCAVL